MNIECVVQVVQVKPGSIVVKSGMKGLCRHCMPSGRCRADWLRQKSPLETFEIPITGPISKGCGDDITLIMDPNRLFKLVALTYGTPLLGLLSGITVGSLVGLSEWLVLGCGFFGIVAGWSSWYVQNLNLGLRIK